MNSDDIGRPSSPDLSSFSVSATGIWGVEGNGHISHAPATPSVDVPVSTFLGTDFLSSSYTLPVGCAARAWSSPDSCPVGI
jgi:hypothetical protein